MLIPADLTIKSTVRPGSVLSFNEESFNCEKNHCFIILNHRPLSDELLLLVWARTLSGKVYAYIESSNLPYDTFLDITGQYTWSKKPTIINCNQLIEKDIGSLLSKLKEKKLKIVGQVNNDTLVKLREGAIKSPTVERYIKKKLQDH